MADQNHFAMMRRACAAIAIASRFQFLENSARRAWHALTLVLASLVLCPAGASADGAVSAATPFHSVDEIWQGYDPRALPLDAEVLNEGATTGLVVRKIRYTSEIADGFKVQIIGFYGFPGGGGRHPAILHIHGGSQVASRGYVEYWAKRGYATLSINWGGLPQGDAIPGATDWGPLKAGLADAHSDRQMSPDARANSWFHWAIACRRALTFLEQQGEVDAGRIGVFGISRGGRLTWLLAGIDNRIAAAASIYGAAAVQDAYTVSKPEEAPFTPADLATWRACLDVPAYAPRIRKPFLFLSAANDFYGVIDRAETALQMIPHGQVWRSYSPHSTHHLDPAQAADLPLWMDRWLKGGPAWPTTPTADVQLATPDHIPVASIMPDRATQVRGVTVYYSTEPNPKARFWRTAVAEPAKDAGASQWLAPLPLGVADAGLWLYANVDYADGLDLSTRLTAIPAEALQAAAVRANEKPTLLIDDFSSGARDWFYFGGTTDPLLNDKPWFEIVAGPDGGRALRGSVEMKTRWRFATRKIVDPQWRAPKAAALRLRLRAEHSGRIVALASTNVGQATERVYAASASLHGGEWETVTLPAAAFHQVRDGGALQSLASAQIFSVQSEYVNRGKTRAEDITIGEPWKGVPPTLARCEWVTEFGADPSSLPTLSDAEKQTGWKLLFDGVSTAGWRGLGMNEFPAVWIIQDGCFRRLGGYNNANDLVTADEYENFELSFEWMIPKLHGNSGVKYRVQEEMGKGYAFGCEYQCMNDPEAFDKHASGALYDVFPPEGKKLSPQGEFNQSLIVVRGQHVEHWLNGVKVVDAEFGSEAMNAALAQSHFRNSDWGKKPLGHIILQDHHSEVFFRNIKIHVLPAGEAR